MNTKGTFSIILIVLLFASLNVSAAEYKANYDADVTLFAPDKLSVLDTFQIKIEIKDDDVKDFANVIDFSGCNYFIYNNKEIKNKVLDNIYSNPLYYYEYNGEKEIILELGSVIHPLVSDEEVTNTYCNIYFRRILTEKERANLPIRSDGSSLYEKFDYKKKSYYADIAEIYYSPIAVPVNIDIKLPNPKENSVKSGVLVSGHTSYSISPTYTYDLRFNDYGKNFNKETGVSENYHSDINFAFDFKDPNYKEFFEHNLEGFDKKQFTEAGSTQLMDSGLIKSLGGTSGFYKFYHSVYDTEEKPTEKEDYVSISSYFMGRVNFHGPRNMPIKLNFAKSKVLKAELEQAKSSNERHLLELINTITLDDGNIDYPTYEKSTKAEEKKEVKDRNFEIQFSGKGEKTIWNRGRMNSGKDDDSFEILVKIDATAYDENGKKIKKPSLDDLYGGIRLVSRIVNTNESQIGFNSDLSLESSVSVDSYLQAIDVRGIGPRLYKGFYKPEEIIEVYLESDGEIVSNRLEYVVTVKDASPTIKLKTPTLEVQDGDKRMIQFDVKDDDKSRLTCHIMIPTGFAIKGGIPFPALTYKGSDTTLVETDCKDADTIKVMYNAPNFGNFNLNDELNALSMWKMQEGTMISLATDLVGFGVEKRLDNLNSKSEFFNRVYGATGDIDNLKNAQRFGEAAEYLGEANGMATDVQNIIKLGQVKKNADDLKKLGDETVGTGKQGWMEWGADWGVFGIDIAQSTVGAIAMAPGKLPVLGPLGKKVGAGFSTSFNLMTNVWKGNLQYLSKVEKIDRAKQMYFPYPVIITIEDEDGFVTKEIQNVMVVYNWLE